MSDDRRIEVEISGLAHGGSCIGTVSSGGVDLAGKKAFVPWAAPGDLVEAAVVSDEKRFLTARITNIKRASPERTDPSRGRSEPEPEAEGRHQAGEASDGRRRQDPGEVPRPVRRGRLQQHAHSDHRPARPGEQRGPGQEPGRDRRVEMRIERAPRQIDDVTPSGRAVLEQGSDLGRVAVPPGRRIRAEDAPRDAGWPRSGHQTQPFSTSGGMRPG